MYIFFLSLLFLSFLLYFVFKERIHFSGQTDPQVLPGRSPVLPGTDTLPGGNGRLGILHCTVQLSHDFMGVGLVEQASQEQMGGVIGDRRSGVERHCLPVSGSPPHA